jgi:hypothetical protein
MGFKTRSAKLVRVTNFFENLPRRLSGRAVVPLGYDPEICGDEVQDLIVEAFNRVNGRVTEIKLMGGECLKLGTCLDTKSAASVYITCSNCAGGPNSPSSSRASDQSLQLCFGAYTSFGYPVNQSLVNGVVLRELIRMCGGKDLDAWALDYYFTTVVRGSGGTVYYPVPSAVKALMCTGSVPGATPAFRVGTFMVWNSATGALYPKQILPNGTVGLITPSLTGLNNPDWQHMC